MDVIDILKEKGAFVVLADQCGSVVRLWTLSSPFQDGRTLRALKRFFPCLEVTGRVIRLGGYDNLAEAHGDLAQAKAFSSSNKIKRLFRVDTPEGLATLKNFAN